jgi:VCBS repeat-containing protein
MYVRKIALLFFCFSAVFSFAESKEKNFPEAVNDSYTVKEKEELSIPAPGILSNDTIPDKAERTLTVQLVEKVKSGNLKLEPDGSFTYIPKMRFGDFEAQEHDDTDQFTYKLFDGTMYSNEALVTIYIAPVNDPPVCFDDHYHIEGNTELTVDETSGLLANDKDPEGDALTAVLVHTVSHGVLYLNYDGSFSYTPYADFSGNDTFTYHATDGRLDSRETTVMIDVMPARDLDDVEIEDPGEPEAP